MLFRLRPAEGLLGGLHELPSSPWQEGELRLEAALGHAPAAADWRLHARPVRHVFTHFVLELTLAEATTTEGAGRDLVPDGGAGSPGPADRDAQAAAAGRSVLHGPAAGDLIGGCWCARITACARVNWARASPNGCVFALPG